MAWFPSATATLGVTSYDGELLERLCLQSGAPIGFCQRMLSWQQPARRVQLAPFAIDRTEVTVAAYRRCVLRGRCSPRHTEGDDERIDRPEHPVTGVTLAQARDYCHSVGGEIPSESEWEFAGRGPTARAFPWGNVFIRGLANHGMLALRSGLPTTGGDAIDGYRFAAPTDSLPHGASAAGILHLSGNAREWVGDLFGAFEGSVAGLQTVKGGSWRSPIFALMLAYREPETQDSSSTDLGFRCAYHPRD